MKDASMVNDQKGRPVHFYGPSLNWLSILLTGLLVLVPSALLAVVEPRFAEPRFADPATSPADEAMASVLVLLAIVAGAYLFSYLLLRWATRRFGWIPGVHYVVLGVSIGPLFGILSPDQLVSFTPVLILGSGAVGLLVGLELDSRRRRRRDERSFRVAATSALITLAGIVGLPALV